MADFFRNLLGFKRSIIELWQDGKRFAKTRSKTFRAGNLLLATLDSSPPYAWFGGAEFAFWSSELQIYLITECSHLNSETLFYIENILAKKDSIQRIVEGSVLEYYRDDVFSSDRDDIAGNPIPTPNEHDRILSLINKPTIYLSDLDLRSDSPQFRLHFLPEWDHSCLGFSVFISNWIVTEVKFGSS